MANVKYCFLVHSIKIYVENTIPVKKSSQSFSMLLYNQNKPQLGNNEQVHPSCPAASYLFRAEG